jgi:arabinofuranan 3-O-arabinosyltransferase
MWLVLGALMLLTPFLSQWGSYVNDTRDALWLDPSGYLSRALTLWHSSPSLGFEQHDGIVFPMGAFIWAFHAAGLPPWVTERLWHGSLLFGAAAMTVFLIDHLQGRRTTLAPFVGGVVYAITPFSVGYGLPFTGTFLAYVFLPLLLLVT